MMSYVGIGAVIVVVLLLSLFFAIANFSGQNYFETLEKTQQMRNSTGMNTYEFVNELNQKHFSGKLKLARARENNDHYSHGVVALSQSTLSSNSLASLATVAHELGHARQEFQGSKLEKLYRLRRIVRLLSFFVMPLLIGGTIVSLLYVFGVFAEQLYLFVGLGIIALGIFNFFFVIYEKYQEIKIEKEASNFAVEYLKEYLYEDEVSACKEFLDSARLTYWSDLFKELLGWTFITKRNKRF